MSLTGSGMLKSKWKRIQDLEKALNGLMLTVNEIRKMEGLRLL